eukprot:m.55579 g.55579  ORF g.55579 m.55579 type:complete len:305 (+) comp12955_c1_seq1:133-1047(+)
MADDGRGGDDSRVLSTSAAALKAVQNFVSGSMGGFACKIVEYPFDTMKVLLQSQDRYSASLLGTLRSVVANHGFLGLYKGLTVPLIGSMFENAVLFSGYSIASSTLTKNGWYTEGLPHYMISGLAAGLTVTFVLSPVELIKCRLQVQNLEGSVQRYKGPVDCLVKVIKEEGIVRGLYRGNTATLLREAPGNMAWFTTYNVLSNKMVPEGGTRNDLAWYHNALAGGFSGMAYWTAFYPADTVKTLQQSSPAYAQQSFIEVFKSVYRQQGIPGLYRGWALTVSRAMPSNAVLFMAYELMNKFVSKD